jgi:hypothetical protein
MYKIGETFDRRIELISCVVVAVSNSLPFTTLRHPSSGPRAELFHQRERDREREREREGERERGTFKYHNRHGRRFIEASIDCDAGCSGFLN